MRRAADAAAQRPSRIQNLQQLKLSLAENAAELTEEHKHITARVKELNAMIASIESRELQKRAAFEKEYAEQSLILKRLADEEKKEQENRGKMERNIRFQISQLEERIHLSISSLSQQAVCSFTIFSYFFEFYRIYIFYHIIIFTLILCVEKKGIFRRNYFLNTGRTHKYKRTIISEY